MREKNPFILKTLPERIKIWPVQIYLRHQELVGKWGWALDYINQRSRVQILPRAPRDSSWHSESAKKAIKLIMKQATHGFKFLNNKKIENRN
jgi:hypothetical protein